MIIFYCAIHSKLNFGGYKMGENVLKNKNYLLLFLGGVVSNLGSHVYNFAYIRSVT